MKIVKEDWKFVPVDPDPNFDVEHNKRVIEETIKNSKLITQRKRREEADKVRERTGAVAQYLNSINTGKTSSKIVDYFGRREMARLRGDEIADIIRAKLGYAKRKELKAKAQAKRNAN